MTRTSDAGGRFALIVATDTYVDPALRTLRAPAIDAEHLASVLTHPQIGAYAVDVLRNPTAHELRLKVEDFFSDRHPNDVLLLHFSCHGLKEANGRLSLAASDTLSSRLAASGVSAEFVSRLMMASRARTAVLILDCCYAGAFERGLISRSDGLIHIRESFTALEHAARGQGRAVLTASTAIESSFEVGQTARGSTRNTGGPSVFTGALIRGLLTGEADRNLDGRITISELTDYVAQWVRQETREQTPQLWIFGADADVLVAHSPRREIRPAPLPPALRSVVASSSPGDRFAAGGQLAQLAQGTHLPLAIAAHQALGVLARDTDGAVSRAAAWELAQLAPRVATNNHVVQPGTPETTVHIGGPALVRATLTVESCPDWLLARPTPTGISLAPAPGAKRRAHGVLVLRSVTGTLTLDVGLGTAHREWRSWQAPRRFGVWTLFALAAIAMGVALMLPYAAYWEFGRGDMMIPFSWDLPSGLAVPVPWAVVPISAFTLVAFTVLTLFRHGLATWPPLATTYAVLALANAVLCYETAKDLAVPTTDYRFGAGYFIWAVGCALQLAGAFTLWRIARTR